MMKQIAYVASVLSVLALVACSSSGSSDEGAEGDQAVSAAHPGELGGLCGGFAGIQCKPGLECKYASSDPPPGAMGIPAQDAGAPTHPVMGVPIHPDQSGTCVQPTPAPGTLGGICGGLAGIVCQEGLHCQYGSGGGFPAGAVGMPIAPDAAGKCVVNGPPPGTMGMPAHS